MEKKISQLGVVLTRSEQKIIFGGIGDSSFDEGGNKCNYSCKSKDDCDTTCPSCEVNTNWDNQKICVK